MSPFLTSKENIVVNLIYEWLGESRINRTFDKVHGDRIALSEG